MDRDTIVDQVSVPEALEMLGMEVPERVPGHVHCFLHGEETPSLMVYEDHWYAYCCGVGGDVVNLVQRAAGATFQEAVAFLGGACDELAGPRVERTVREVIDLSERFYEEPLGSARAEQLARELIGRKWPSLSLEDLWSCGVKLTEHALWVPHVDTYERVVGVKTRSLYTGAKNAIKGSTFTSQLYYPWSDARSRVAVLCEGESDTWAMQIAWPSITAYGLPAGAKTWRPPFLEQLRGHDIVCLALDTDRTGREATESVKHHLTGLDVRVLEIPGEDVADAIGRGWQPVVPTPSPLRCTT